MANSEKKGLVDSEKELRKIGARLRGLRKAKGYSNPDKFAYDHELNRSQYGKYEAGSTNITIGSLVNILNIFGITLEEFFGEEYGKD